MLLRSHLLRAALALSIAASFAAAHLPAFAAGSDIKVIVNKVPITSLDVSRRVAFLKLQRSKGNLASLAWTR